MFVVALLMSLASAVFISLRIVRLRQNLLRSSGDPNSPQAAPKGCHTRAAASVTLSVLAFVLMLVAAITVWVGVLPLAAWYFASYPFASGCGAVRLLTFADGPGASCAGVVIATSFIAMVLDASSHCCCKSAAKGLGVAGGPTTVVIMPPAMPYAQVAYPQQQLQYAEPHRVTVYSSPPPA